MIFWSCHPVLAVTIPTVKKNADKKQRKTEIDLQTAGQKCCECTTGRITLSLKRFWKIYSTVDL